MPDRETLPRGVTALFAPTSVALVGASADNQQAAGRPLDYLVRDGWLGRIYPVNSRRTTVRGQCCWRDLRDLPEVPEHVYILTATDSVIETVETCGQLGVSVVTILAGGFGESGTTGRRLERRLRRVAAAGGVRLLGTSSIGVIDLRSGFTMTASAAFRDPPATPGSTLVASQSGSLIGALYSRGRSRGIGFAAMVSVGAEVDLTIGEICAGTLDDPSIESYALFLESLSSASSLRTFALEAASRSKPVMVYKLGRSEAAAELVATHTGAVAGADDVANAFLADCGFARVDTIDGLLEGSMLASSVRPASPSRARVGVLTAAGGGAALVVDQLAVRGVDVVAPSSATMRRIADTVKFPVGSARIVDLTLRGTDSKLTAATLSIMRMSGDYHVVVQVLGSSAISNPDDAVKPAIESAPSGAVLAVFVFPEAASAIQALARAGVAAFRSPESCGDAISALLLRRPVRLTPETTRQRRHGSHILDPSASVALVNTLGIDTPSRRMISPTVSRDLDLEFPVVLKATGPGLEHKTEVGAVAVDIRDGASLDAALVVMRDRLSSLGLRDVEFALESMVTALCEVLLGFVHDEHVGPYIVLAPGGVHAELHSVRSIRMAPIDVATALEMIEELPLIHRVLDGFRGGPAVDSGGLAHTMVAFSQLAHDPLVYEAEINPLMVGVDSVCAVDTLIRVVGEPHPSSPVVNSSALPQLRG